MNKVTSKIFLLPFIILIVFLLFSNSALARSWWGDGYKTSKWVLKNGGTIIRYEIEDISGNSDEYKVVMYDKNKKYIEVEDGIKGFFDDAKENTYEIKAFRNIEYDEMMHHKGKSFATIKVRAHPGETIRLKFDYKKKKVKMTTDYVKPTPKPIKKPTPIPVQNKPDDLPDIKLDEEINNINDSAEQEFEYSDLFLRSVNAKTFELSSNEIVKKNDSSENKDNIFIRIWNIIKSFFLNNKNLKFEATIQV